MTSLASVSFLRDCAMSYGAPFAAGHGHRAIPKWHKEHSWSLDGKFGRNLSDVSLDGSSYHDPCERYNSSAHETLKRQRSRVVQSRSGVDGCLDFDDALASTWATLSTSGFRTFEPHSTLVPRSLQDEMKKTGMTFASNRGNENPGGSLRDTLQSKRRNPAMVPKTTFVQVHSDRDKRRYEWDSKMPAGPPLPTTPTSAPPPRDSAPPSSSTRGYSGCRSSMSSKSQPMLTLATHGDDVSVVSGGRAASSRPDRSSAPSANVWILPSTEGNSASPSITSQRSRGKTPLR
eukprot:TRINITY_DN50895_c0_g1_i1.p1 TRINITY_DN50895_c0_g1~~TRINITY_DN50895_c0_g1_i1.p1  ORF type:complete len:289 (-),score=24.63 TRINITY_DN50895_c0_g1_i1:277-1143(-)